MPRPAMLVDIVTAPRSPARATIAASLFVVARIQDVVRDAGQRAAQPFGLLDAAGSHQDRLALSWRCRISSTTACFFLRLGREDRVRMIYADHRAVGRDHLHRHSVDLLELDRLGRGGAGHAADRADTAPPGSAA